MAYQNQKVKARQTVARSNTQTKGLGIVSVVPMDLWNPTTQYQKLNLVRYNGATYIATQDNQGVTPTVKGVWQPMAYDGGAVSPDGSYPQMSVGQATNDSTGTNISEQFSDINSKIPSTASEENQLADKAFVNSSINAVAAYYITPTASGDEAFSTHSALINATTFYNGGQPRVPTQNDYAIVQADETQTADASGKYPTTRYSYQGGTYPNGAWEFQYIVNNTTLTNAQLNAINSGITAEKVNTTVTTNTIQTIGGTKTFTSSATQMYGLRLKNGTNYGCRLNFGDGDYVYLEEPADDVLKIHAKSIMLECEEDFTINDDSGMAGQVLTSTGTGSPPIWKDGGALASYPIGALYISTNSTSPASLFGGSWTAIGSGYYLKAITSGASTYNSAGLPNIVGMGAVMITTGYSKVESTGAFKTSTRDGGLDGETGSGRSQQGRLNFSAADGEVSLTGQYVNNVYGKSDTVTPKNYGVYMWRRTA